MTALIACFIDIVIDQISIQKYGYLKDGKDVYIKFKEFNYGRANVKFHSFQFSAVDKNVLTGDLYVPYLKYAMVSAIPVAIGSWMVAYIEPVAGGKRIQQFLFYYKHCVCIVVTLDKINCLFQR